MEYKITPQLLTWSALAAPFRVQVLLLVILLADDNGCCGITTPGARQSMESRTTISWTTFLVTLRELHKLGVIDFDGKVARITNLPEGIEVFIQEPERESIQVVCQSNQDASPVSRQSGINSVTSDDFPEGWWQLINVWLEYKRKEKRGSYKSMATLNTFYKQVLKMTGGDIEVARRAVTHSIANTYMGLILDPTDKNNSNNNLTQYERTRNQARAQLFAAEAQRNVTANTAESGDLAISDF